MPAAPDPARRALLLGAPKQAPLRPPWALDEAAFTDACTACGACTARCPERVLIHGETGYPTFDPARGECTFCGECELACTPRALDRQHAVVPWALQAQVGADCLPRHGVVCSSCRDACPERAIAFPLSRALPLPAIDTGRCTGCGACVSACPVAAIALRTEGASR